MKTPALRDNYDTINLISPYPAAGKGTAISPLKQLLERIGPVGHIEVGSIVRSHKQEHTLIGQAAADFERRGLMVPDEIIVPEIRRNVRLLREDAKWLFDGYPRTGSQVQGYHDLMIKLKRNDVFVYLNVPRETAEERMIARGKKAQAHGKTPRTDDVDPEARKTRLDGAEQDMQPVIDYAQNRGNLIEIDGSMTPEEVQRAVRQALFMPAHVLECMH